MVHAPDFDTDPITRSYGQGPSGAFVRTGVNTGPAGDGYLLTKRVQEIAGIFGVIRRLQASSGRPLHPDHLILRLSARDHDRIARKWSMGNHPHHSGIVFEVIRAVPRHLSSH